MQIGGAYCDIEGGNIKKDGDDMTYDELEVGMDLILDGTDGDKKIVTVVRKGIDGFGQESVVFGINELAQCYCKAKDVPLWYIRRP